MTTTLNKPRLTVKPSIDGRAPAQEAKLRQLDPTPPAPAAPAEDRPQPVTAPVMAKAPAGRRWIKHAILAAAAIAALAGASTYGYSYYTFAQAHESTDDAFIDAHVAPISPRIAGHVEKVYVTDNQQVHAGDLLVELDPSDYQAALDAANGKLTAAKADLVAAKSQVIQSQAAVTTAEAQVAQAQADQIAKGAELDRANQDLARYTTANKTGVVSATELTKIQTDARTAQANLDAAIKVVAAAQAGVAQANATVNARQGQVAVADAQITSAQAGVETARLNLSYTKITAPTDGRITKKGVEPGMYVVPGQLPALFALVQPEVWVTANFKETQLAHMKPGQAVEVKVDAYPGVEFPAHLDSIQQGSGAYFSLMPPENATGNYVKVVQRVPVKITFDHPEQARLIGPGMSVEPVVTIK